MHGHNVAERAHAHPTPHAQMHNGKLHGLEIELENEDETVDRQSMYHIGYHATCVQTSVL